MPQTLSPTSLSLLANWQHADRRFFRKYSKDVRAMEIVSALAELIATYETRSNISVSFYC